MSDDTPRKIAKWPFLLGDLLLVVMAFYIIFGRRRHIRFRTLDWQ